MTAAQKTKIPDGQRFPVHGQCQDFNPVLSSASTPPTSQTSRRLPDTEQHCGLGFSTAGWATNRELSRTELNWNVGCGYFRRYRAPTQVFRILHQCASVLIN